MMSLPSLPTDNLYKFKVFGGFSLLFFAAYIFLFQVTKNLDDLSNQKQLLKEYQNKIERYSKILNESKNELQKFKNKIDVKTFNDSLKQKSYRDYAEFMIKNDIVNLNSDNALIYQIYENRTKVINNEINKTRSKLDVESIKIDFDLITLILVSIVMIISTFIGETFIKKGFKEWLHKVQIPLDKKLKKEVEDQINITH